ncbi:MAG: hypothetical protein AAF707_00060 [Pseudomonadota bacterium]
MILALPETDSGINRVRLQVERVDYAAPEASGRQGGVQAGWPLWSARFEMDRIDPVSADQWCAFVDRLRGRINRFYSYDPTRTFPLAYPSGFAAFAGFAGAAASWSQAIQADGSAELTLTGLPVGLALGLGDYVGFKWDASGAAAGSYERRTMARNVGGAAVASSAGEMTVTIEPPVNTALVPASSIAHLDRPQCVMQQVPEETELGPTVEAGIMSGATIVGIQDLRP